MKSLRSKTTSAALAPVVEEGEREGEGEGTEGEVTATVADEIGEIEEHEDEGVDGVEVDGE